MMGTGHCIAWAGVWCWRGGIGIASHGVVFRWSIFWLQCF